MKQKTENLIPKMKNEKGATGADIVVALSIIVLTVSVISMIYVNVSNNSKNVNRTAGATRIATNILENINIMIYDEFNSQLNSFATNASTGWTVEDITNGKKITLDGKVTGTEKIFNTKVPKGYTVELISENIYGADTTLKFDLMKKITVTVKFTVSKTEENVSLYTSKEREVLEEVNKPELDKLSVPSGQAYVPIRYSKAQDAYLVVDENDENWYNYGNKNWAMVYMDTTANINSIKAAGKLTDAQKNTTSKIYYWIPRFSTDGKALYGSSKHPIEYKTISVVGDNSKTMTILSPSTAELSPETNYFNANTVNGLWVKKSELTTNAVAKDFNSSKFGPVQY